MQTTYGPQRSRSMLAAMKNLLCVVGIMRLPFSKTEFNEQLINVANIPSWTGQFRRLDST
jgi:hypothetical protein